MVKNLPEKQETGVRFLGQEDPLEKEMAIHSSIQRSLAGYSPRGYKNRTLYLVIKPPRVI